MVWPFKSKSRSQTDPYGFYSNLPNIPPLTMFLVFIFVILPAFGVFFYFWSHLLGFWSDRVAEYAPFTRTECKCEIEAENSVTNSPIADVSSNIETFNDTQMNSLISQNLSYENPDDNSIPKSCHEESFHCASPPPWDNKRAILPWTKRCDGTPDCWDRSDELNCTKCLTGFSCPSGDGKYLNCVKGNKICNGIVDCIDRSDELLFYRKKCKEDEFKCLTAERENICLPSKFLCDGESHCPYGDDEVVCEFCRESARICHPNIKYRMKCIGTSDICDSTAHCADHFDERFLHCNSTETCPGACHLTNSTEFELENHYNEYLKRWNSYITYSRSKIHCSDGKSYNPLYACNGNYPQCDGKCYKCMPQAFLCPEEKRCIPLSKYHDGVKDCTDGTDEANCTDCTDCSDQSKRCDGFEHCSDGSDEKNCTECANYRGQLSSFLYTAYDDFTEIKLRNSMTNNGSKVWINNIQKAYHCKADQRCISIEKRCDGREDCSDGQDEEDCSCAECFMHPYDMYVCRDRKRCFRYNEVCDENFVSKCPNAVELDKQHCELLKLEASKSH